MGSTEKKQASAAKEGLQVRIARMMHWQRQVTNARGAQEMASRRGDRELVLILATEAQRAEAEREAAILAVGVAAEELQ